MKKCPVCNSNCFDDMETCYGCMHRFDTFGEEMHTRQLVPIEPPAGSSVDTTQDAYSKPAVSFQHIIPFEIEEPPTEVESALVVPIFPKHGKPREEPVRKTGRSSIRRQGQKSYSGKHESQATGEKNLFQPFAFPEGGLKYQLEISLKPVPLEEVKQVLSSY